MVMGALYSISKLNLSHEVKLIRRRRQLSGGYSIKFYGHLIRKSAQNDMRDEMLWIFSVKDTYEMEDGA